MRVSVGGAARWFVIVVNAIAGAGLLVAAITCGIAAFDDNHSTSLSGISVFGRAYRHTDYGNSQRNSQDALDIFAPLLVGTFWSALIGIVICILAVVGMVKRHEIVTTIYIVLHFLALIAEIVVLVMYFVAPYMFHRHLQELMMGLVLDYVAEDSQDLASDVMENFMRGLNCCGYYNGTDFDYSVHFDRRRSLNGIIIYLQYPIPCCKHNERKQRAAGCPQSFTLDNSNIRQGCWPVFDALFHKYVTIIGCGWIGIVILQILVLIAAIFYVRTKLRRTWPFGLKLGQSTFEDEEADDTIMEDEEFVE